MGNDFGNAHKSFEMQDYELRKMFKRHKQWVELKTRQAELRNDNRDFGKAFQVNIIGEIETLTWSQDLDVTPEECEEVTLEECKKMVNDISFTVYPSLDLLGGLGLGSYLGDEAKHDFYKGLEEVCRGKLPKLFHRDSKLKQLCAFAELVPNCKIILFLNMEPRRVFLIHSIAKKVITRVDYHHDDEDVIYMMYSKMGFCMLKCIT